jgi:hypothetical protein
MDIQAYEAMIVTLGSLTANIRALTAASLFQPKPAKTSKISQIALTPASSNGRKSGVDEQ